MSTLTLTFQLTMLTCFFINEISIKHGISIVVQDGPVEAKLNLIVTNSEALKEVAIAVCSCLESDCLARVTESHAC